MRPMFSMVGTYFGIFLGFRVHSGNFLFQLCLQNCPNPRIEWAWNTLATAWGPNGPHPACRRTDDRGYLASRLWTSHPGSEWGVLNSLQMGGDGSNGKNRADIDGSGLWEFFFGIIV